MNGDFVEPLVLTQRGGATGGGAGLTASGKRVLTVYRAIERDAEKAVAKRLPQLLALIRPDAGVDP
jgi:molybdate transport system regulatory protein